MPKLVVRWPAGPIGAGIALLCIVAPLAAFVPSTRSLPVLKQTWQWGLVLLKSEALFQQVAAALVLVHLLESIYTFILCSGAGASAATTLTWMAITVLVGFPALLDIRKQLAKQPQRPEKRRA